MEIKGNLDVLRRIKSRRSDQGCSRFESMSASETITMSPYSSHWNVVDPIDASSNVDLPPASALSEGYEIVIHNISSFAISVNLDGGFLLQSVPAGDAYKFTLYNADTPTGLWHINYLELGVTGSTAGKFALDFFQHDFGTVVGDLYEAGPIVEGDHGKGANPIFQLFKYENQGSYASFSGTVLGVGATPTGNISIEAEDIGTALNGQVILTGDAATNVNDLVAAWNAANPTQTVVVLEGGTEVPDTGETISLSGGVDPSGDKLKVFAEEERVNSSGDISIRVSQGDGLDPATDGRFDGRVVVV